MSPARESTAKNRRKTSSRRPVRPGVKAPRSEKVQASFVLMVFSRKFLILGSVFLTAILLISGSYLWFNKVYSDPENVFWGMVDRSLATRGVTRQFEQQATGGSSDELQQLSWNPEPRLRDIRQINYTQPPTQLVIESLSTPTDDYQHYTSISAPSEKDGKPRDYSRVYNMWLHNAGAGKAQSGNSQSLSNAIFGPVIFGNFRQPDREVLVELLHKAYEVDFDKVEKRDENGRMVYVYTTTIKFRNYAEAIKLYAEKLGLPSAGSINPQQYKPDDTFTASFVIDVRSRQLRQVEFKDTASSQNFSGYGIATDVELPSKTVSSDELQKAIDSISQ